MSADRRQALVGGAMALLAAGTVLVGQYRPAEQSPLLGFAVAAVAALAAGSIAYLAIVRPWWGMLAFLLTMPLINMARAQLWIGPIQVISATPVIAALVVGVLIRRRSVAREPVAGVPAAAWWILGAGAALAVLATLLAPLSTESLNITLHGLIEPMLVLACVLALLPDARAILHAAAAIGASVVLASLANIAWLVTNLSGNSFYERRIFFARLTYFNVGIFGGILVAGLPLLGTTILARARMGWPRWLGWLAWAGIGIGLVALFYTFTKSAWISAAVGLALLVLLLVQGWLRRAGLLGAIAVLLAVVVPYPSGVLDAVAPDLGEAYRDFVVSLQSERRVESWDPETEEGAGSVAIRWVALSASLEIVGRYPVLGVGPGQFGDHFRELRPDATVANLASAHNFGAQLATEYGLPLAMLVAFAILVAMVFGLTTLDEDDPLRRVAGTSLTVVLVAYMAFATLFGIDLYRTYRTMNADVVMLAALLGLALSVRWSRPVV